MTEPLPSDVTETLTDMRRRVAAAFIQGEVSDRDAVALAARLDEVLAGNSTPELTATLVIGTFSSTCGHCGEATLASAVQHTDISGWTPRRGQGCGARFVDMRADNNVLTDAELRRTRPDLPIHGA